MRNKHQLLRRRKLSTARDPIRWQWLNHASPAEEIRAFYQERLQQQKLPVIQLNNRRSG
jgi:hypothetical protein